MILFCMLQHLKENKEFIFVKVQETNGIDSVLLVSHARRTEEGRGRGRGKGRGGRQQHSLQRNSPKIKWVEFVLLSSGYKYAVSG